MNDGPILIVDDDIDDKEVLFEALKELKVPNQLIFFDNGEQVLQYLNSKKQTPFLILCDVNIPKMDGFELKAKIWEDTSMNYKSIPFVFWSTEVSNAQIQKAYNMGVNGFFVKQSTLEEIKKSLADIVNYWLKCIVPE